MGWWNGIIDEEEKGARPRSNIKLKNAYHLQEYYKDFKREMRTAATLVAVHHVVKQSLRREYRQQSREMDGSIPLPALVVAAKRTAPRNNVNLWDDEQDDVFAVGDTDTNEPVRVVAFTGAVPKGIDPRVYRPAQPPVSASVTGTRQRQPRRCRKCGRET
jgi:hypothetical protein